MLINIKSSNSILDFCLPYKKSFSDLVWPNSKIETWKMTPLNKFINNKNNYKVESYYKTNVDNKVNILKEIDANNIQFLKSNFFKNSKMTDIILSNISSSFEVFLPDNFSSNYDINFSSIVESDIWASSVIVIKTGKNVKANIKFDYSLTSNSLCTPLILFDIDDGSNLSFGLNVINKDNSLKDANFISLIEGNINKHSNIDMVVTQQGVNMSRSDINMNLKNDFSSYNLTGIYFGRDKHHQDITACVNHLAQNTSSNQIVRGILDDSSVGVYQGGIKVAPKAQKTDGKQMSRALLLSKLAESNSKPELEIFADDVTCAHGATIGELDKDQFFYLLSRGISYNEARDILIKAYLSEILSEVQNEFLYDQLDYAINFWLDEFYSKVAA